MTAASKEEDESNDNNNNNRRSLPQPSSSSNNNKLIRRLTVALSSDEEGRKLHRRATESSPALAVAGEHVMELEFEEWDSTQMPFYKHCIAGSLAGVAEHLLMYPFDTLKTQIQSYTAASATVDATGTAAASGGGGGGGGTMLGALRQTFQATGGESNSKAFMRLWRGAQAMAAGCIPAHAMYFSSYEIMKSFFLKRQEGESKNLGAFGSTVAGSMAALTHDAVMVPADTIKQRLQLGYYNGMADAFKTMIKQEGAAGLYRALPVTLCTNIPYGAVMVTTNEHLREIIMKQTNATTLDVRTTLLAGCGAGAVAAAVTTPLDRLKTRLQTQGLGVVVGSNSKVEIQSKPKYSGLVEAFQSIVKEEGYIGLFRGLAPRLMTHTPSVAVSWTVYEAMKLWLSSNS